MAYIIEIKRKETVPELVKEYQKVGENEVERDHVRPGEPRTRTEPRYEYVTTEKNVTREIEVLKQTVETIDLPAVIRAINGI